MTAKGKKLITIISPCYNEEDNVRRCHEAVKELFAAQLPHYDLEHIFADNASADSTPELLKELAAGDKRVKVILNSRNFGPFRSTFNALRHASGDAVLVMLAVDLQDPPDMIPRMIKKWEEGYQVVSGARKRRREGFLMRNVRKLYYRLVSRMCEYSIPLDVGEFQLIDRVVVQALRGFDDYYPYIRGMIASCGFKATILDYTWQPRRRGLTKNSLYHLIDQALNGVISSSNVPLRLALFFGFGLSVFSILYAAEQLIVNLLYYRSLIGSGRATVIVTLFFFSGVQFFFLGLLGEYINAIHSQARRRPLVIERETLNFEDT